MNMFKQAYNWVSNQVSAVFNAGKEYAERPSTKQIRRHLSEFKLQREIREGKTVVVESIKDLPGYDRVLQEIATDADPAECFIAGYERCVDKVQTVKASVIRKQHRTIRKAAMEKKRESKMVKAKGNEVAATEDLYGPGVAN